MGRQRVIMADINQRSLWRDDPYWASNPAFSNPYVQANNRADINDTYGATQPPQLNVGSAQASPVRPPGPTDSYPLPPSSQGATDNRSLQDRYPDVAQSQGQQPGNPEFSGIGSLEEFNAPKEYGKAIAIESANAVGDLANATGNLVKDNWIDIARFAIERAGLPPTEKLIREKAKELKQEFENNSGFDVSEFIEDDITESYADPESGGIASVFSTTPPTSEPSATDTLTSQLDFLKSNKPPDESLEDFAKRIGVDLKDKPYSNWDYIRDMSAGLLASKEDNFFGALGDASIHSNTNRDKAVDKNDTKRTALAVAKWQSDLDWDKLEYKQKADIYAAAIKAGGKVGEIKTGDTVYSHTDNNGNAIDYKLVTSNPANIRSSRLGWIDGLPVLKLDAQDKAITEQRTFDNQNAFIKTIDSYIGTDKLKDSILESAETAEYNGELLVKWKTSDTYAETMQKFGESQEEAAKNLIKAIDNNDSQAAFHWASILQGTGQAGANMAKSYYTGLWQQMSPGDHSAFEEEIRKRAIENMRNAYDPNNPKAESAWTFMKPAIDDVINSANYDEKGVIRFAKATPAEIENARVDWDNITGLDENNSWFNIAAFNFDEFPDGHPLKGRLTVESPLNTPHEYSAINKNQYELLNTQSKQQLSKVRSELLSDLKRNSNMTPQQALYDINNSIIDSNSIYGGEDIWLSDNKMSRLDLPNHYNDRPPILFTDKSGKKHKVSNNDLMKKGVMWNGFKNGVGQYYTFQIDPVTDQLVLDPDTGAPIRINVTNLFKAKGFTFGRSRAIPIE